MQEKPTHPYLPWLLTPKPFQHLSDQLAGLIHGRLWLQVLIGMVLGVATGFVLGPSVGWLDAQTANVVGNWLAFPGQLFLTLIQMIVIPLVFASVIRGLTASENIEQLRKLGIRVVIYFVLTTAAAIIIGLWVAKTIEPGRFIEQAQVQMALGGIPPLPPDSVTKPNFADIPQKLLTLLPANPLSSMVEGQMLQVVLFAVIFGVAMMMLPPGQSRPLTDLLSTLQEVCMIVVRWAMRLAPLAVFGLMAQITTKIGLDALVGTAAYVGTVLLGLAILFGFYLLAAFTLGGTPPRRFVVAARDVMLLAFSTSSSAAVMPLSIKTAEEKLGIRPTVAQFVIPLGATINMNGTALYQGVATIFLAQVFGVDVGTGGMLLIVLTAVGASIGSPATPGVGIVILAMVLETVHVPAAGIALLIGVDRILDMSRTAINVCGDLVACKLMDRWLGDQQPAPSPAATPEEAG